MGDGEITLGEGPRKRNRGQILGNLKKSPSNSVLWATVSEEKV